MLDKELIQLMMQQIDKIGTQQETILVKQTELAVEQKHLSIAVDEIKEDVSEIQNVQSEHTNDIRSIKESLKDSQSFKSFCSEFAKEHPILTIMVILMLVNMVLVSLGLPLINISGVWTAIGGV